MVERVTLDTGAPADQAGVTDPNLSTQDAPAERPAWLPAEFKTVEDFAKSYQETRAAYTRTAQELAEIKKAAAPKPEEQTDPPAEGAEEKPKTPEGKDLRIEDKVEPENKGPILTTEAFQPYHQEFIETGDVAPENRAKIAKELLAPVFGEEVALGMVNDYVEGQKLRRSSTQAEYEAAAGGKENLQSMLGWAAGNLSKEEKLAFNRAVDSGDFHAAKFAIEGLRAKYEKSAGRQPNLLEADASGSLEDASAFKSVQEMTAAMRDPRYKTDPAYRAHVLERVKKSNV